MVILLLGDTLYDQISRVQELVTRGARWAKCQPYCIKPNAKLSGPNKASLYLVLQKALSYLFVYALSTLYLVQQAYSSSAFFLPNVVTFQVALPRHGTEFSVPIECHTKLASMQAV